MPFSGGEKSRLIQRIGLKVRLEQTSVVDEQVHNIDVLEVALDYEYNYHQTLIALVNACSRLDLERVVVHMPYRLFNGQPVNIFSTNDDIRALSQELATNTIDICRGFKDKWREMFEGQAPEIFAVIHLCHPTIEPGPETDIGEVKRDIMSRLPSKATMANTLAQLDPGKYLRPENLVGFPCSIEDLVWLSRATNRPIVLDWAHLFMAYDFDGERIIEDFKAKGMFYTEHSYHMTNSVCHMHFSQINDGLDHQPINTDIHGGTIYYPDIAEIIFQMLNNGATGVIEVNWDYENRDPSAMIESHVALGKILTDRVPSHHSPL